jgi:hypothetical protein
VAAIHWLMPSRDFPIIGKVDQRNAALLLEGRPTGRNSRSLGSVIEHQNITPVAFAGCVFTLRIFTK